MTVADLSPAERDDYEERAAILQFDANLDRAVAEAQALVLVLASRRWSKVLTEERR